MNSLRFVAELRGRGIKPACVGIEAVPGKAAQPWFSDGTVHAEIGSSESLSDMDFRPLVGLKVQLGLMGGDYARVRQIAKRAAEVKPSVLAVFDPTNRVLHRLWADGRTHRLEAA